jgi:hypothetical protein
MMQRQEEHKQNNSPESPPHRGAKSSENAIQLEFAGHRTKEEKGV